jgi:hypothetical protein
MILATNIIDQANSKKVYLINKKRFLWGNIKPDCASKYKFKKHYYDESIEMILELIGELSSLSVSEVYHVYGKKKFSEELGVVCHFLCDYFCLAHNQRWEFKNAMKKHVIYENTLAKIAKVYKPTPKGETHLSIEDVEEFITQNLNDYDGNMNFKVDLQFSYYMCNSIVNAILNQVVMNGYVKERKAV